MGRRQVCTSLGDRDGKWEHGRKAPRQGGIDAELESEFGVLFDLYCPEETRPQSWEFCPGHNSLHELSSPHFHLTPK